MTFKHEGLKVTNWQLDDKTIELAKMLNENGASLKVSDAPLFQPFIETFKNKKIPMGWLGMIWTFALISGMNEPILLYEAEDKFQTNLHEISDETIKEILLISHANFREEFEERNKSIGMQLDIRPLLVNEVDDFCQHIKDTLKDQGF